MLEPAISGLLQRYNRKPAGSIDATTIATGIDLRAARVRLRRWQGRSEPSAETGSTQPMCLFK
jgi:hypothetical protein